MAVKIVAGESWIEGSADGFVEHCRKFGYFENLSDKEIKYAYHIADLFHFGIRVDKTGEEIVDIVPLDTILTNYFNVGLLNKLLIECRLIRKGEEIDMENVDLEKISILVRSSVDITDFISALNRLESINDYTYYLTKDYWTFVCISDSIFI